MGVIKVFLNLDLVSPVFQSFILMNQNTSNWYKQFVIIQNVKNCKDGMFIHMKSYLHHNMASIMM